MVAHCIKWVKTSGTKAKRPRHAIWWAYLFRGPLRKCGSGPTRSTPASSCPNPRWSCPTWKLRNCVTCLRHLCDLFAAFVWLICGICVICVTYLRHLCHFCDLFVYCVTPNVDSKTTLILFYLSHIIVTQVIGVIDSFLAEDQGRVTL